MALQTDGVSMRLNSSYSDYSIIPPSSDEGPLLFHLVVREVADDLPPLEVEKIIKRNRSGRQLD